MSEKRILIPEQVEKWFGIDSYGRGTKEKFYDRCTTPIRSPDEWTDINIACLQDLMIEWHENPDFDIATIISKVVEIATRPPSDPVKMMDIRVANVTTSLHQDGRHSDAGELERDWQAVKKELLHE